MRKRIEWKEDYRGGEYMEEESEIEERWGRKNKKV